MTHIRLSPMRTLKGTKRVQVDFHVYFRVAGAPRVSAQKWFVDPTGQVYRIAVGAPSCVPVAELADDLDRVAHSFRPLVAAHD